MEEKGKGEVMDDQLIECSYCEKEYDKRFITFEYVHESDNHNHQDISQKHSVCIDCKDYWEAMHSLPLSHKDFRQSELAQEILQNWYYERFGEYCEGRL